MATRIPSLRSKLTGNMDIDTAGIAYRLQELQNYKTELGHIITNLETNMTVRGVLRRFFLTVLSVHFILWTKSQLWGNQFKKSKEHWEPKLCFR